MYKSHSKKGLMHTSAFKLHAYKTWKLYAKTPFQSMAAILLCAKVLRFPLKSCLVSQDMARFPYSSSVPLLLLINFTRC